MLRDSFRTIQKAGDEIAIVATFPERTVTDANGVKRPLPPAVSVHKFNKLDTTHELASICPNTRMSSFTVAKKDPNFLNRRFDYLVPANELQSFLTSSYVTSSDFAIQVCKRMNGFFLIQLQQYATPHPNFVAANQKAKETAIQFLASLPVEPLLEVASLPEDTTAKSVTPATVTIPQNVQSMSNEELLALLQS